MSMEADGVYKLAILGGGPAGIGILVRAARLGLLPQLLQPPDNATRGVALIHGGPVETLGVGNLGDYIINSNTYAKSLVTSILEEKPELDPPESVQGTFLANLATHATATRLMDAGNTTIALAELGKFLGAVGQEARLEMLKYTASSTCYVNTTALRVERIVATAPSVDGSSVEPKTSHVCKITIQPAGGTATCIFAESVVLAMGGKQSLPTTDLSASQLAKTWLSDAVLREPGRGMLASALAAAPQKKVCIVGGSHSAFSVAWTLLQKPTQKDKTISFAAKDITILHRAPVRCYYATKKEAEADGVVVDKLDKCGSVNTFTGLREDAKALFQAIEAGKETRVRLFHVRKQSAPVQTQALDAATAIVWCCGYGTNMIPLVHGDGTPLEVSHSRGGAVEIDLHGRLVRAETHAPIDYLFGIGVGFSLRAAFDEMRTETRADGVTVYHRRGATLILASVFGTVPVYGHDCVTFEQMVEKCERRRKKDDKTVTSPSAASHHRDAASLQRLATAKQISLDRTTPPSPAAPAQTSPAPPSKLKVPVSTASTTCHGATIVVTVPLIVAPGTVKKGATGNGLSATKSKHITSSPSRQTSLTRRSSFGEVRRHTSHSNLRIDPTAAPFSSSVPQAPTTPSKDGSIVVSARSCGKPAARSVAGGAKDAIQSIRSGTGQN
ncbi:hypothetical protein, variant [Aphanomyces astaci]|uniref:L-ornithine N(5)-monooxygenase n=1 Tax=Aphanomyces astaci TaxID=112090 RepID=W4GU72_APHAT|nr:hypothetical protein, variant [Aphanomyces astaci]ETV83232.1 hypothetical protein, variant [Aphanomyces astaci]|eukprot:XP_009826662.1 hypothetical protein, variant [Aphanomyces astaci]